MAFDLTCLAAREANARLRRSAPVGARRVTVRHVVSSTPAVSGVCTSSPPAAERSTRPQASGWPAVAGANGPSPPLPACDADAGAPPRATMTRQFFLWRASHSSASGVYDGATSTSTKSWPISSTSARSISRLVAMIEPNADTGSHSNARRYASTRLGADASPLGLVCLMIATVGAANSCGMAHAASRSTRLL